MAWFDQIDANGDRKLKAFEVIENITKNGGDLMDKES